ncbi:hypothetical protein PF005_g17613 [Phytophthora fragariae]|uniref:Uncharacterized protein n=1 Tax=Phytophthora fragariae TaxID=53985 RepID=A0A6A3EBM4_9STRA|nr:hypothetical protein PF009_g18778 [Phytophthora fragariae]KAE8994927.1 hypothetical protein PF011_g16545 [Phytophthora fragariae]KAE9115338.1 hypothetical protein PF007_g10062 [Phytophthora fragariae]KAE9115359.1 hypothetical protein PF010_g9360 [Phytophthora fragariae]KAE9126919.1 hypothetical protein PF006_g16614 [Phytophthora fragariae]
MCTISPIARRSSTQYDRVACLEGSYAYRDLEKHSDILCSSIVQYMPAENQPSDFFNASVLHRTCTDSMG